MNLRRILQGLALCLFVGFFSNDIQAQAQLAGVSQDGLVQIGANHPFVVSTYEIEVSHLNLTSLNDATDFFRKYIEEGFNFTFDFGTDVATLTFDLDELSQYSGNQIEVWRMNQKLKDVQRLRR
jgi:hypothetical protein